MEKRSIDFWLPPIEGLCKTIQKVVNVIQHTYDDLRLRGKIINSASPSLLTFEEAINKRKEELRYYRYILSNCQNAMRKKLEFSHMQILAKINFLDDQLMKWEYRLILYTKQYDANTVVNLLHLKIGSYKENITILTDSITQTQKKLKRYHQIEEKYSDQIANIQFLKQRIRKLKEKRKIIAAKRIEIEKSKKSRREDSNSLKYDYQTIQKSINASISSLNAQSSRIHMEISDVEAQKTQIRTFINLAQTQLFDLRKCVNETVSRATQKCSFRTNVIDEMKSLIQIRKERSEFDIILKREKSHYFDLKEEIDQISAKIDELKKSKKRIQTKSNKIEEKFLKQVIASKQQRKSKRKRKVINIDPSEKEYDDYEYDKNEEIEKELEQKKASKEVELHNLEILKRIESTNVEIISLRQKIRETQESIVFQTNLQNERAKAKKDRQNQSIFFSFEKIQNLIEEKKIQIDKLKTTIKEDKVFIQKNSQYLKPKDRIPTTPFPKAVPYFEDFIQRIKLEKKRWILNLHSTSIQLLSESWNEHLNELDNEFRTFDFVI